jgi:hypothetical protein
MSLALDLWHNPGGMLRCFLLLALGCSALLAQEPVAPPSSGFHAPQNWFQWKKFASVQPQGFTLFSNSVPQACSVPLLVAPIDPNLDLKMPVLKTPAENLDRMPVAKGLPPCSSQEAQPEMQYLQVPGYVLKRVPPGR